MSDFAKDTNVLTSNEVHKTCADCYWYSDITIHVCDLEKEPVSDEQEACPLFEPKEE